MLSSFFRARSTRQRSRASSTVYQYSSVNERDSLLPSNRQVDADADDNDDNDDDYEDEDEDEDEDGQDVEEAAPLLPIFSAAHLGFQPR